jgi:hypothetical protein
MTFYPILTGHIEVRVDRRDPRPPRFSEQPLRRRKRGRR